MTEEEMFDGWTWCLECVYMVHSYEETEKWAKPKYMKDDPPLYTPDQEFELIKQQIEESEGFDIDFDSLRCLFNYQAVDLDEVEIAMDPETTNGELVNRLSQESLEVYNQENDTKYEYVNLVKANFHMTGNGVMFLITFQVKDPFDSLIKPFQARVHYSFFYDNDYVFCRPKPDQKVVYVGVGKKDAKKPRLE